MSQFMPAVFVVALCSIAVGCQRESAPELVESLELDCTGGSAVACGKLGAHHLSKGSSEELPTARAAFERACELEPRYCDTAGVMNYQGLGGPQDFGRAHELFERGCGAQAGACTHLGTLYAVGEGVPRDSVRAMALWEKACPEDRAACHNLGGAHLHGSGVERNVLKAREYYGKAACPWASE